MPKVSVILPNYNHSKYLKQRIDSILMQTFSDFELIILDDKSPDDSKDVIEQYRGNEKISHIVYNEKNSGSTFIQWDLGFSLAVGEYIWIAESDDYAEPTFLEKTVAALDANIDAAYCFSDSNFVDSEGKIIKKTDLNNHVLPNANNEKTIIYEGIFFAIDNMVEKNYVYNASMVVFRKKFLSKISSEYKTYKGIGDWVFWFEMSFCGNVARVAEKLNNFRQHNNKVTTQLRNNAQNKKIVLENAIRSQSFFEGFIINECKNRGLINNKRISDFFARNKKTWYRNRFIKAKYDIRNGKPVWGVVCDFYKRYPLRVGAVELLFKGFVYKITKK